MTIILFLLVLGALVFVHELGHFLAAKKLGVRVDEFALGFPPKLFGKKKGETTYVLNLLPIGGYVKIHGEDPNEESISGADSGRSFANKPWWAQSIILVAGVFGNILFAWMLFTIGFMIGMPTAITPADRDLVQNPHVEIISMVPDGPGARAGLIAGDTIHSIAGNGNRIEGEALTPESIALLIASGEGKEVTIEYLRGGEKATLSVTPEKGISKESPESAVVGMVMAMTGITQYGFLEAVREGLFMTIEKTKDVAVGLGAFFAGAFTGSADLSEVTGPVGIVGLVGDASRLGLIYLITFTAFISLNLAVINVLPFPALDGGRLLFVLAEAIRGKRISSKIMNMTNGIGLIILLGLIALVTVSDISKFF